MSLEKFTKPQTPDGPAVTIRRNGSLSINSHAVEMFHLEKKHFVTLFFDQAESFIAIKPLEHNSEPSTFRIRREKSKTLVISCQSFLKHCGILYREGSKTYPVGWSEKDEMILVNIA
jgi:hypothetical protein